MAVVAAGVHDAKLLGAVAQLRVELPNGQGINVGPEGHDPLPLPLPPENGEHPGAVHPFVLGDADGVQLGLDALGGPELLPAHLGVAVELPAQFGQVRAQSKGLGVNIHTHYLLKMLDGGRGKPLPYNPERGRFWAHLFSQ